MNQPTRPAQWVCEGAQAFRPSDWSIRLAGLDARFDADQRLRYSAYLKPVRRDGRPCVCLDGKAESERPALYREVMNFARQNGLDILSA